MTNLKKLRKLVLSNCNQGNLSIHAQNQNDDESLNEILNLPDSYYKLPYLHHRSSCNVVDGQSVQDHPYINICLKCAIQSQENHFYFGTSVDFCSDSRI